MVVTAVQQRASRSRTSSEVLVHTKGFGSLFQCSTQAVMSAASSATESWAERCSLGLGFLINGETCGVQRWGKVKAEDVPDLFDKEWIG